MGGRIFLLAALLFNTESGGGGVRAEPPSPDQAVLLCSSFQIDPSRPDRRAPFDCRASMNQIILAMEKAQAGEGIDPEALSERAVAAFDKTWPGHAWKIPPTILLERAGESGWFYFVTDEEARASATGPPPLSGCSTVGNTAISMPVSVAILLDGTVVAPEKRPAEPEEKPSSGTARLGGGLSATVGSITVDEGKSVVHSGVNIEIWDIAPERAGGVVSYDHSLLYGIGLGTSPQAPGTATFLDYIVPKADLDAAGERARNGKAVDPDSLVQLALARSKKESSGDYEPIREINLERVTERTGRYGWFYRIVQFPHPFEPGFSSHPPRVLVALPDGTAVEPVTWTWRLSDSEIQERKDHPGAGFTSRLGGENRDASRSETGPDGKPLTVYGAIVKPPGATQ